MLWRRARRSPRAGALRKLLRPDEIHQGLARRRSCARGRETQTRSQQENQLSRSREQIALDRLGKSIVVAGVGYRRCLLLYVGGSIAHGNGEAAFAEHQNIVWHIADCGNFVGGDTEAAGM